VISVLVFFVPANIAPAGISGLAIIANLQLGTPIGIVTFLGNIPILFMAYRMLGGLKAVMWTVYVVVLYSAGIELLQPFFSPVGVSDDALLNAVFAGAVGGIGGGLIYRAGGSYGGTSTLARILQEKLGMPLSTTYMYVNLAIVGLAGVFLGWESALLSLVALMVEGIASDYMLEGPSVIRTATIVTTEPQVVSETILHGMRRGVTGWEATGMYTGEARHMLFVTVSRPQATQLKALVLQADPKAFIIIGHGHTAYGEGFKRSVPTRQ